MMTRDFNFRLLYRVVFVLFCVVFVCFYSEGSYNRRKEKTEARKFKREFAEKDPGDGSDKKKETEFGKIGRKGNFRKHKNIRSLGGMVFNLALFLV